MALTQAIPGMLEVGRLHAIPGMLKGVQAVLKGGMHRWWRLQGHSNGAWLRAACSTQEAGTQKLQSKQQGVWIAGTLRAITGGGSE